MRKALQNRKHRLARVPMYQILLHHMSKDELEMLAKTLHKAIVSGKCGPFTKRVTERLHARTLEEIKVRDLRRENNKEDEAA